MKKMIILVGLLSAYSIQAETYQRISISEIVPLENMYASYEILNPKYEKIVLDCQSFIHGMNFFDNKKRVREIKMVNYNVCEDVFDFINQSKLEQKSVCMEIAEESNTLNLSNDVEDDCQ